MPRYQHYAFKLVCLASGLLLLGAIGAASSQDFEVPPALVAKMEKQYGAGARIRIEQWQRLMADNQNQPLEEKLRLVNDFFNKLAFVDDATHWHQNDYWATPVEMLASAGGDCEDFSIGKYFTLKALGVPEAQLRLTYVKALRLNQAHMVLTYFATPAAQPLVLDNLIAQIKPAGERLDLQPVYSFNGAGLWLAKQRGSGQLVGGSERISLWQNVLQRMRNQDAN